MGSDLTLYEVVSQGEKAIQSEENVFLSDHRPYIVQVEMIDMLPLWGRIGEGMFLLNVIDKKECNDVCPLKGPIINCNKCPLGFKLDYWMMAQRGDDRVRVFISNEVVDQFTFEQPFWEVKVKELFYCGIGYGGCTFLEDKSPFDDFEYPRLYHTPEELDIFKNNLVNDYHMERVERLQKEFKKALKKDLNVFVWGSY